LLFNFLVESRNLEIESEKYHISDMLIGCTNLDITKQQINLCVRYEESGVDIKIQNVMYIHVQKNQPCQSSMTIK
jgi:hypothetical protein